MNARSAYTVLWRLGLPLALARLWWRGRREPGYREGMAERLGYFPSSARQSTLWIHAVSVGEARAAAPLVQALRAERPHDEIVMTCTTAAGRETLRQLYGETVRTSYLPYDYPEAVQRFLEHFRPRLGIVMETEVWPNLLAACARHAIPVALANARMSERSAHGYERWSALFEPAFASLAAVCAQSGADAERLRRLGARSVEVTGNLKFDVEPDTALLAAGRAWRERVARPVLLLASTREGEEKLLLDALLPSSGAGANLLVVVVPRHPQRFDEIAALADSRRSRSPMPGPSERIHLGDTMGEMAFYFAACDAAIIGGSFLPLGGQNLIEAFAAGAPVIAGPSMFNFAEATRLAVDAGAAVQVPDARAAADAAVALLADRARREQMSRIGKQLCEVHRGATERHMNVVRQLLARPPADRQEPRHG